MADLKTDAEITWCPGCGNFGILTAVQKAILGLEQKGIKREDMVITAGIGCHAKIFDYLNLSGLYSLHGRDVATAQGIKLANPKFLGRWKWFGRRIRTHNVCSKKKSRYYDVIA